MRHHALSLCLVLCVLTLSRAALVEVATAEDFVKAVAVTELNSNVEIKLTDHVALDADISLDNITSLAIWGDCATAPENVTTPKSGMCSINLGNYNIVAKIIKTETGEVDPVADWVQLYFDNIALMHTGGEKFELKYTTLWLVDSMLSGFQETQMSDGSLYMIDSEVVTMPLGMSIGLSGGADAEVASESSAVFVGSTINSDKFPNVALAEGEETGYVVVHESIFTGTGDLKFSVQVADNKTQTLTILSDSPELTFYDVTAGNDTTAAPFSTDAVSEWTYHEKNMAFLDTLVTDGAPGAEKAKDPFGTGTATDTPLTPDSVSGDAPPSKSASPTSPVATPPAANSSAGKSAMALAASVLLMLVLV